MKVKTFRTIEEEKEINFPYYTQCPKTNTIFCNPKENQCITISSTSIDRFDSINCGLEHPEIPEALAFAVLNGFWVSLSNQLNK